MIDTYTSQKALMKFHESDILDMKFSRTIENVFGSINNGYFFVGSIYSPEQEDELSVNCQVTYSFPVSMIYPSPDNGFIWAIGYKNQIALVDTEKTMGDDIPPHTVTQYDQLPFYIEIPSSEGVVTDFVFNNEGTVLLVTLRNNHGSMIHIYDLPDFFYFPLKSGTTVSYTRKRTVSLPFHVLSVVMVAGSIITVSINAAASTAKSCCVTLTAWSSSVIDTMSPHNSTQTLSIQFPYASQYDHTVDDVVHVKTGAMSKELLVICHNKSNIVGVINLRESIDKRFILTHTSLLNVVYPVIHCDALLIEGKDHHSDVAAERLVIYCYQEGEKASVQQYHAPCNRLIPAQIPNSIPAQLPSSVNSVPVVPSTGESLLQLLKSKVPNINANTESSEPSPLSDPFAAASSDNQSQSSGKSLLKMIRSNANSAGNATSFPLDIPVESSIPLPVTNEVSSKSAVAGLNANTETLLKALLSTNTAAAPVDNNPVIGHVVNVDSIPTISSAAPSKGNDVPQPPPQLPTPKPAVTNTKNPVASSDILVDIKKLLAENNQVLKKEIVKEVTKAIVTNNNSWKDELSNSIISSIQNDIAPTIAQKVRDAVKESVKVQLQSAFRAAFENSLLPAFQVGTDRMFAQVQESFEIGMDGLVEQGRISQQISAASTQELLAQIAVLRSTITSLESKINNISRGDNNETEELMDPLELLEQGKVADAIECALEHKNINALVRLLNQLSFNQVTAHCSSIATLCCAQQLADDLAQNRPIEGMKQRIEWLKNLVIGLTNKTDDCSSIPSYNEKKTALLQGILRNLNVTKEKFGVDASDIPEDQVSSITTDINMLIVVISSQTR